MRKKLVIPIIYLCALFLILNNYVLAQKTERLTKEQMETFRSAKTVRIVVEQSYGEAKGVCLPFEETARKLLVTYSELKVVKADRKDYDVALNIHAKGRAGSAKYFGYISGNHYTGASLNGSISLSIPGLPAYEKSFHRLKSPAGKIEKAYPSPSYAPFAEAFKESDFVYELLEIIGDIYGPSCLVPALKDKDSNVRKEAASVLGKMDAIEALIPALEYNDKIVRIAAIKALGKAGDSRAVEPLIVALKDRDLDVASEASFALGMIGDNRALEPVIGALKSKDEKIAMNSAFALGKFKDSRAVEPLIVALKHPSIDVRYASASALGAIKDSRAVESLVIALKDKNVNVRRYAAQALGEIKDYRAIKPLIFGLQDEDSWVKEAMADSLKKLTGKNFGDSHEKWQKWWEENKEEFLKKK